MMRFLWLALCLNFLPHALAGSSISDLQIQTDYRFENDSLTTEKIWTLDPQQSNPHLQRWIVSRQVKPSGLKPFLRSDGKYGAKASGILSNAQGYIRGPGPWYRPISEFPCHQEPQVEFETPEGAKRAMAIAAELWSETLKNSLDELSFRLSRVKGNVEKSAEDEARLVFKNWLESVEVKWRAQCHLKVRSAEWKYYQEEAASQGLCQQTKKAQDLNSLRLPVPPTWRSMMEPITGEPPSITQVLARAPARLWNGLFSIRLTLNIAGRNLNGRFLIDTGAGVSVISPSWLESQGIYPAWIEMPGAPLERVMWSGLWSGEKGLARRAIVDRVELGGLVIPMNQFLLLSTPLFNAPENAGSCCDGVLGTDFLRLFPMEFQSEAPAEVRVWPRQNFHWGPDNPWVEVTEAHPGDLVSSCMTTPSDVSKKFSVSRLAGVRWDTGNEDALSIHTPWRSAAEQVKPNLWKIGCDTFDFAHDVVASFPKPPAGVQAEGPLASQIPAVSVGMPLLSRGKFTFDLPHGRLWFSKDMLAKGPPRHNHSGLSLVYVMVRGDRVLKVKSIQAQSRAQNLIEAGLKPGMIITQIDSKSPSDIDLWEVEQRLAGNYGDTVSLQWQARDMLKMAPLKVRN